METEKLHLILTDRESGLPLVMYGEIMSMNLEDAMMIVLRNERLYTYCTDLEREMTPNVAKSWVGSIFLLLRNLLKGDYKHKSATLAIIQREWRELLEDEFGGREAARFLMECAEDIARDYCEGEENE